MIERVVKIVNPLGIHARPSASLVKIASKYSDNIELYCENNKSSAKSIMGIMALAMAEGVEVKVVVSGNNEVNALEDICNALIKVYEY
jgi:phosphocarrier protein